VKTVRRTLEVLPSTKAKPAAAQFVFNVDRLIKIFRLKFLVWQKLKRDFFVAAAASSMPDVQPAAPALRDKRSRR
jgi:hypothetical protein